MPRKSPLKVFRTAIGFHDAYVAAPSRKAALAAWGAGSDLFAVGSAELVTDPALTAEPLAAPGQVIKRVRGSVEEHLTAAAKSARKPAKKSADAPEPQAPAKPARRPKPRPSREELSEVEAALDALQTENATEMKEFDRREAELRRERKAAEARQQQARGKLETRLGRARAKYEETLERWRTDD